LTEVAIIGAGGHTRSLLNIVRERFSTDTIRVYDDSFLEGKREVIGSVPLVGPVRDIRPDQTVVLSVGENELRKKYFLQFDISILRDNLYHGNSIHESSALLGESNQFFANSYIGSEVEIAKNNIINSGSIVEHESVIGSHNHIAIGAKICGRVSIGDSCLIGAGSVILDRVKICDKVVVAAGSVVTKHILEPGVYIGTPAVRIK